MVERTECEAREAHLVKSMNDFSQCLVALAPVERAAFLSRLDFSSSAAYQHSAVYYRDYYRDNIMGRVTDTKSALNLRSRVVAEGERYTCHEVVVDVATNFILEGYLLLPKGFSTDRKHPLVVVQHGLNGTPSRMMEYERGGGKAYREMLPTLANAGYLVFAPQNPHALGDRFRQLTRKLNPLGLTIYSLIHFQYEQMFNLFAELQFADLQRVAFLGLSYGGKTSVRVPAVMSQFCLNICSGDFNEGVVKMASTRYPFSFALLQEYEMFEFGLGRTFNYADLAALAAPRPFMAQRGHSDAVAWDEFVGYEYARLLRYYESGHDN